MKNEIKRNERIESKLSEVANMKATANEYNQHILNALEEIARTENLINNQTVKVFKIEKEIEILTAAAENSADAKETDKIQFDIECKTREIENAKNLVKGYNQSILNAIAKIGVHEDVISRMGIEISAAMKEIEDLQASIVEVIEVDVTEYAVSPDAQEVAVQAEVDNAAREVVVEEVITTADLEKQLEKVLEDRDSHYAMIEDIRGDIKYVQALIIDCYKTIADYENVTNDALIDLDYNFKEIERLQAESEKLQAEITNRKLNAAAVGMVDDGTNEEDAEEMTIDYNFDDEDSDDELIDPPIEYHIVEVPAAVELEPVTFAIERFGEVAEEETKLREEYAAIEKEIAVLNEKFAKMHGRRYEVGMKINAIVEPNLNGILQKAKEAFKAAKAQGKSMEIVTPDGNDYYWIECGFGWELVDCYVDLAGEVVIDIDEQEMARYVNWKAGTAAIEGLVAAIERGDEVYTFPTNA